MLCALCLSGGVLAAAGSREERAYAAALTQFHDNLFAAAETNLVRFVKNYPKSAKVAEAALFQAQARFQQGHYDAAIALLADTNYLARAKSAGLLDSYADWTAQAQFASGDFLAAARTWLNLTHDYPESPLCLRAVVEAATAYGEAGHWSQVDELLEATNGVFATEQLRDAGNPLVVQGGLLLAQSKNVQQNFAAGRAILEMLAPRQLDLEPRAVSAELWLQNRTGAGDLDGVLVAASNLVAVARLQKNPDRLAAGYAALADTLERQNQLIAATRVWAESLSAEIPPARQQEAVLKIAGLSVAQDNFSNAVAALELFLNQYADGPAAGLARLTLGELHLKKYLTPPADPDELAAAEAALAGLLLNPSGPLAAQAFLDRGWCGWLAGNWTNSLADFGRAAEQFPPGSTNLAVARFKVGDVLFQLDRFDEARTNYQSVLDDFAATPAVAASLGAQALYQIMRANLKQNNVSGAVAANTAMRQLLERFPGSELSDKSLLLTGEGFLDFDQPTNARAVFEQFAGNFPASPLKPEVAFAVARTFEREPNWPAAVTNYQNWLANFPGDDLLPQVKFALAQAEFHAGHEPDAFQLFSDFITEFPTNELAPLAQWWVADHFFRATNFAGGMNFGIAETNYENIFQTAAWKNSPLVYPAQLMAGRAAMARLGFSDATTYFSKLLTDSNCPAEIRLQARFAYAHALMQSEVTDTNKLAAYYQAATNLLSQVGLENPTNETGALAWSEIGDACQQVNDLDAATNAYVQVLGSAAAGAGLRNRAQVGLGMVLEKKAATLPPAGRSALLRMALDNYRDVLYNTAADPFWAKKAGLQALPLMLDLQDGDMDKFFESLERWLPQLTGTLEKKKAALKAARN